MTKGATRDIVAGGLLLALAVGYYALTKRIAASSLSDEVGPEGLPTLLAAALAIVAVLLVGKALLASRRVVPAAPAAAPAASEDGDERATFPRALGFAAIGVGYMLVAPWVGFALGVALLILAVAIYEGERFSARLALVAAACGVGFWLVFARLLGVEQPVSPLWEPVARALGIA